MEITTIKTLLKSSEFEELFKTISRLLKTDRLKTAVDNAGLLNVKAIKAYSSITEKSKEIHHSTASVEPHPKQLLLTGNIPL